MPAAIGWMAGAGSDLISYFHDTGSLGVTIDLGAGRAARGGEVTGFKGIENADGSNQADTITGDDGANHLGGAGGNDTLHGRTATPTCWWGAWATTRWTAAAASISPTTVQARTWCGRVDLSGAADHVRCAGPRPTRWSPSRGRLWER
ncbi:MAG: hypothetical protein U1E17_04655 [Geminicoccaceae bacterium]